MTFGEFLRAARKVREISLRDLEKRTAINHAHLHRIETGELPTPSWSRVVAIVRAVGIDARSSDVLRFLAKQDVDERLIYLFLQEREIALEDFALAARMKFHGVPAEQPIPTLVWRAVVAEIRDIREKAERTLLQDMTK